MSELGVWELVLVAAEEVLLMLLETEMDTQMKLKFVSRI
jgi:hypothetical protein